MRYIHYNSDEISKLSLGTVQFGLDYGIANNTGKPTQEKVNQILQYVYENNINCLDTAQAYGNSEEVLSAFLHNKEDIYIISKLKSELFTKNTLDNLFKSLSNLQKGSLYALLLHDSELLYHWQEKYTSIVNDLLERGLIKYFGVSIYTDNDFELAIQNENIKFIQIPFNIFDQRAIIKGWFEKAKQHNKLIFIRSVFLQGLLFMDKDNLPANLKDTAPYLDKLDLFCKKLSTTRSLLALNFVDSVAKDSLILFGCDNLQQAKENIDDYNNLEELDVNILKEIFDAFQNVPEEIYNPTKWNL